MRKAIALLIFAALTISAHATQYSPRQWGIDKSGSAPYPLAIFDNSAWSIVGGLDARGNWVYPAGTTARPAFHMNPGVAPTSPQDGDVWATSAGLYMRLSGVSVLVAPAGGSLTGAAIIAALGYTPANKAGDQFGGAISVGTGAAPNHEVDVGGNIGVPAGGYYNFGATDGSGGYGFRDNGGTIQFKNAGGIWNTFAGGVASVSGGAGVVVNTVAGAVTVAYDFTQGNDGVQQTVQTGPVSSGAPSFWSATYGTLTVTVQNLSSSIPLVLDAWGPNGASGTSHITCALTSNSLSWSGLPPSVSTLFLYATLSTSAGACTVTPGVTSSIPVYQTSGTPSTASGQITCNIYDHQCYLGNGSTAPQTAIVVLGEITTGTSTVTATIPYAYGGYYDSGWINTIPSAGVVTSKNSALGTTLVRSFLQYQNLVSELGYQVGDVVDNPTINVGSGQFIPPAIANRRTTTQWTNGGQSAGYLTTANTGFTSAITPARWAWRLRVKRDF